jgi:hypothetical protein
VQACYMHKSDTIPGEQPPDVGAKSTLMISIGACAATHRANALPVR